MTKAKTFWMDDTLWDLEPITYEDLIEATNNGAHVSDWAWDHAEYVAKAFHKGEVSYYYLSHFYKRDIKEIMERGI